MKCIQTINSKMAGQNNHKLSVLIGTSYYSLGFQVEDGFIRIMLIWWHVFIDYKSV